MKRNSGNKTRLLGNVVDVEALTEIRNLLGGMPRRRDLLIEYLHLVQDHYKHISRRHIQALAEELKLPQAEVRIKAPVPACRRTKANEKATA